MFGCSPRCATWAFTPAIGTPTAPETPWGRSGGSSAQRGWRGRNAHDQRAQDQSPRPPYSIRSWVWRARLRNHCSNSPVPPSLPMRDGQTYCNRASTRWYTMDKATPSDYRKPPKQVRFPDAVGRPRTYASQLVAGAGVSGSSPLVGSLIICRFAGKTHRIKARVGERPSSTYLQPYRNPRLTECSPERRQCDHGRLRSEPPVARGMLPQSDRRGNRSR